MYVGLLGAVAPVHRRRGTPRPLTRPYGQNHPNINDNEQSPRRRTVALGLIFVLIPWLDLPTTASGLSVTADDGTPLTAEARRPGGPFRTEPFSVALRRAKPRPASPVGALADLWNDPRPVTSSLLGVGGGGNGGGVASTDDDLPYRIVSDPFDAVGSKFEIELYPRGFVDSSSSRGGVGNDGGRSGGGVASAYLRYSPTERGREIDAAWTLCLVDGASNRTLSVTTCGGLPRSNDTWSAAMTMCDPSEAVEGVGRTHDWGSSIWSSDEVRDALVKGNLRAEGVVSLFGEREGETSWTGRGAIGAVRRAAVGAGEAAAGAAASTAPEAKAEGRTFRAGEVIVPTYAPDEATERELERVGVYGGVDYRIMTISDCDGRPIFDTASLPQGTERGRARLALRPTGWKAQKRLWDDRGFRDWPVEVNAYLVASSKPLSRFNAGATLPRFVATYARDAKALILLIALALAPLPLAVAGREFVSLYEIPSASMDPTLVKGDVLLVEKLPGAFERVERGDVVLFRPPPALEDIIRSGGGGKGRDSRSLFVKRVVGLPGDGRIVVDGSTGEVSVGGAPAVGPDRNLCDDEPLRLIDRLLESGKGKDVPSLGEDDVYVLGDCKAVSVDSRVFGTLPKGNIAGKPIARIWPLSRYTMGPL